MKTKKKQIWKASRKPGAKRQKPRNFGCEKLKAEKSGHTKKFKAKSFIINGEAKSQKRKFYHTAFQLCLLVSRLCPIFASLYPGQPNNYYANLIDCETCNQMTFSRSSQLWLWVSFIQNGYRSYGYQWKFSENGYCSYVQQEMVLSRVTAVAVRIS